MSRPPTASNAESPELTPSARPRNVIREGADRNQTAAVIDIGTSSIRMAVAEIDDARQIRLLESLSQGVTLGKDTFTKGVIEKQTIEECVRVLKLYRAKLEEFLGKRIGPK